MRTVSDSKMHEQQGSPSEHGWAHTHVLIMKRVRNVFPNYDYRGRNAFLIRGRNVFPKYEEGAKRLS